MRYGGTHHIGPILARISNKMRIFYVTRAKKKVLFHFYARRGLCAHAKNEMRFFFLKKKRWAKTQREVFFPFINAIPRMIKWKAECAFDLNANVCVCARPILLHCNEFISLKASNSFGFANSISQPQISTMRTLIKGINSHQRDDTHSN